MTRFRHHDGGIVHLAYCTNVHPAEDLAGVIDQLRRFAAPVRQALGAGQLGVGLWLAAPVAAGLRQNPDEVARLREALLELQLEVVTFNGFPYRAFHAPVVKLGVYQPDWTTDERADYTLDLAWLLTQLLPADATEGSISTLPLGWREGWTSDHDAAARRQLGRVAAGLDQLAQETGRRVRLALEPEPGCTVETSSQAIAALSEIDPQWIGICLDACHMAVQFERAEETLAALSASGVPVVKAQASAALRVSGSHRAQLAPFVEPRFLHQTRACVDGTVRGVDDLDQAFDDGLPEDSEWRVHFHVPVHHDSGQTTQPELQALLTGLVGGPELLTPHVELETYTWEVLPETMRPRDAGGLVDGLAEELRWLERELTDLGLEAVS